MLMTLKNGPLLLVQAGTLPPTVAAYLTANAAHTSTVYVFGGELAIADSVVTTAT